MSVSLATHKVIAVFLNMEDTNNLLILFTFGARGRAETNVNYFQ